MFIDDREIYLGKFYHFLCDFNISLMILSDFCNDEAGMATTDHSSRTKLEFNRHLEDLAASTEISSTKLGPLKVRQIHNDCRFLNTTTPLSRPSLL